MVNLLVSLFESEHARINFLMLLCELSLWCFVISIIDMVVSLIKNKKFVHKKSFYIYLFFFFLFSTPYLPKLFGYRTTQIGHLYEARSYTETYEVIMSRDPESKENRKAYTLPAQIFRQSDYDHTTSTRNNYYGGLTGDEDRYILNYHIRFLYFPNGGYLSFDSDYYYDDTVIIPNKETEVIDSKGDRYYITLTKAKTKRPVR